MRVVEEPSGRIDMKDYFVDSRASAMDGVHLCLFIIRPSINGHHP